VQLSGSARTFAARIVAEGPVRISGSSNVVGTDTASAFSVLTAATGKTAVTVDGSSANVKGTVFAPAGDITVTGSSGTFTCGLLGVHVNVAQTASGTTTPITSRCLAP
jgi:hypothetical protein